MKRHASALAMSIAKAEVLQQSLGLVFAAVPLTTNAHVHCMPFLSVKISTRQPLYSKRRIRLAMFLINACISLT